MARHWRDEDREYRGNYEGEFERERARDLGERGNRDFGHAYGRDYGSEPGRYGGFQDRAQRTYNLRSDYDRGPFPYDADYGAGPRYGGGLQRDRGPYIGSYGYGRDHERDYAGRNSSDDARARLNGANQNQQDGGLK